MSHRRSPRSPGPEYRALLLCHWDGMRCEPTEHCISTAFTNDMAQLYVSRQVRSHSPPGLRSRRFTALVAVATIRPTSMTFLRASSRHQFLYAIFIKLSTQNTFDSELRTPKKTQTGGKFLSNQSKNLASSLLGNCCWNLSTNCSNFLTW